MSNRLERRTTARFVKLKFIHHRLTSQPARDGGGGTVGGLHLLTPATFSSLADAVAFIVTCLDNDDHEKLAAACIKPLEDHPSIPDLYAGKQFPESETQFKLGGHAKELGHIHVDFVRNDDGWAIEEIWQCR